MGTGEGERDYEARPSRSQDLLLIIRSTKAKHGIWLSKERT